MKAQRPALGLSEALLGGHHLEIDVFNGGTVDGCSVQAQHILAGIERVLNALFHVDTVENILGGFIRICYIVDGPMDAGTFDNTNPGYCHRCFCFL